MKNLKRVLSMALASVMLVGMMAVGASAANASDFTDSDEITHTEAVNTMAALGIIKGKDTGAFDPNATVTRSEMAKLITVMMNGGVDPVLGTKSTPTFTDIKGHWAEQYIEYCASNKIIGGRGDGTFDPDGKVTGSEAAKMALTALGYDATVYGFVGVDWEINTNTYANLPDANLYDGIRTVNPTQPISRDNVAQMLYKTLDAFTKKMTPTTSTNGTIEWTYTNGSTMMEEKFNAVKVEGVVVANEFADVTGEDKTALEAGKTEIKVTNYSSAVNPPKGEQNAYGGGDKTITVKAASGEEDLGRSVSVYVKKGTSASKAELLGDLVISANNVVVTAHDGKAIDKLLEDEKLDPAKGMVAMKNYGETITKTSDKTTVGDTIILVDNDDDGEVEYTFVKTYVLGYVSKKSVKDDGSITVTSDAGKIEYDDKADVVGFDDVEKDDYVLASEFGGKLYLTKPETVTGDLEAYKGDGSKNEATALTVDDEKYDVSNAAAITSGTMALNAANAWGVKANLGNEATFYLDANNRVVAVGEVETSGSQYAISWGGAGGNKIDNNRIKLTLEDGTTKVYTINSRSELKIGNADGTQFDDKATTSTVGTLVSYTMTSSGEVKLSLPAADDTKTATSNIKFEKGKTMVKVNTDTGAANSSTVFFYVTMTEKGDDVDKVTVYTGYANAPSVDQADKGVYALNNKDKVAAAVFFGSSADGAQADHLFLYKWDRTFDGYREAHVYLAGSDEHEVIKVDEGDADMDADAFYTYSMNADGYYELTAVTGKDYFVAAADKNVTAVSKNTVIVSGEEYFYTEAVVIDNIEDPSTPDASIGGAIADGQTVMMIVDDDKALMIVITADVVEDDGNKDPKPTVKNVLGEIDKTSTANSVTITKVEVKDSKGSVIAKGAELAAGDYTVEVTLAGTASAETNLKITDVTAKGTASADVTTTDGSATADTYKLSAEDVGGKIVTFTITVAAAAGDTDTTVTPVLTLANA